MVAWTEHKNDALWSQVTRDYKSNHNRSLGLRHLVVANSSNEVEGIITRKDLMGFSLEDKLIPLAGAAASAASGEMQAAAGGASLAWNLNDL